MSILDVFRRKKRLLTSSLSEPKKYTDQYIAQCFYNIFKDLKEPVYKSKLIQTMIGRKGKKLLEVDESLIGCLNLFSYFRVKSLLYYLISKGYLIFVEKNQKYLVYKTDKISGLIEEDIELDFDHFEIPKDEETFILSHSHEARTGKQVRIKEKTEKSNKLNQVNENDDLYCLLLKKRDEIAKDKGMPRYLVFQNQTLKLLAEAKPKTKDSMLRIYGIGEKKFESYGQIFIDLILEQDKSSLKTESKSNSFEELFSGENFVSQRDMVAFYDKYKENLINVDKDSMNYLDSLDDLNQYRDTYNKTFIDNQLKKEEDYLDTILDRDDPNITLDKKQREVVLRDEDYTLVVAGAGAGKTTTVAAKVKYLVEKKGIEPDKILIVSYTNDAVNELKDRINKKLNIPAIISTFHKVGYAIVRKTRDLEEMKVAHDAIIYNVIKDYLNNKLIEKVDDLRSLILFFGYYIDAPASTESIESFIAHIQRNDFTTMKSNLKSTTEQLIDDKAQKRESIKHEVMRSLEEVQIANFLYLHHVDYEYEKAYPFSMQGSNKVYTPDFTINHKGETIYLEHFGISESGDNNRYQRDELEIYKKHINDKISLHKKRNTKLIYTFSSYNDNLPMVTHLRRLLEQEGVELRERSLDEVYQSIIGDDSNKYFNKLIYLIKDFISSFKINGYSEKDFNSLHQKTDNVRNKLFLKICKPIYLYYQSYLLENNLIDFEDMINESSRILQNPETKKLIPDFEYAIIDEYQDISQQRFDLSKALSDLTNAKIIAVGDDWQSIFAFAGSRIDLFLKFKSLMGYADYLTIDSTYRNAQEVIDIAGSFIQKNDSQLKKRLKSPKSIDIPITLYEYSDIAYKNEKKGYKGIMHEKAKICDSIIGKIIEEQGDNKTIALLGRYNFELTHLERTDFFTGNEKGKIWSRKYPKVKLLFYTVHGSKGLGFDNVIILNGSDEVFGFPSQIEMDPLLKLVKYDDQSYSYAEERRLFYVALTRTKNQVHILYPKSKPSEFVLELARDYDLVNHPSSIYKKVPLQDRKEKLCPNCGYPLQLKNNKTYGLKLFMCTNEPEICGYMTNNLRSGKKSISKCPDCLTGFLIVKHSVKNEDYFFGCTNYRKDGKGCNHLEKIDTGSTFV